MPLVALVNVKAMLSVSLLRLMVTVTVCWPPALRVRLLGARLSVKLEAAPLLLLAVVVLLPELLLLTVVVELPELLLALVVLLPELELLLELELLELDELLLELLELELLDLLLELLAVVVPPSPEPLLPQPMAAAAANPRRIPA